MSRVERVLLLINRSSATAHNEAVIERVRSALDSFLGNGTDLQLKVVDEHGQAREQVESFLAQSSASALVISGGGGGTLRAVIEGVCRLSLATGQ